MLFSTTYDQIEATVVL